MFVLPKQIARKMVIKSNYILEKTFNIFENVNTILIKQKNLKMTKT